MKTETVTITPAMAEKWLAGTSIQNRPLKKSLVKFIADQIRKGQWQLNGETIILDDNGNVIDGQHRLRAIIEAEQSVRSIVVRGANPESFLTIDSGITRGGVDVLALAGYQYARNLGATANCIESFYASDGFYDTPRTIGGNGRRLSKRDYLELAKKYEACIPGVQFIHNASKACIVFRPPAFAAAMHYLFGLENPSARDRFFNAIHSGVPVFPENDPTIKLRRAYETQAKDRQMRGSAKFRYELWRTAWDQFKAKHEREQRKPAASLRFAGVSNGVHFPESH